MSNSWSAAGKAQIRPILCLNSRASNRAFRFRAIHFIRRSETLSIRLRRLVFRRSVRPRDEPLDVGDFIKGLLCRAGPSSRQVRWVHRMIVGRSKFAGAPLAPGFGAPIVSGPRHVRHDPLREVSCARSTLPITPHFLYVRAVRRAWVRGGRRVGVRTRPFGFLAPPLPSSTRMPLRRAAAGRIGPRVRCS